MLGGFRRVARKVQLLSLRRGVARRCQLARAIPLQPATGAEVDANSYTVPARVERDADGALLAVEADLRAFHVYIIGGKRREHLGKKQEGGNRGCCLYDLGHTGTHTDIAKAESPPVSNMGLHPGVNYILP